MMTIKKIIIISVILLISNIVYADQISKKSKSSFYLEEATIQSIQSAIKNKEITCEQLVNAYIERIKLYNLSVNQNAPLNAIAVINLNALDQARVLDQSFAKGQMKGSLFCIPIVLKDNIDSYDSTSSSGSMSLLGNQPTKDAFITTQLRNAGAIILGKSTMDEFASGTSGISSANGRIGNAYDTSKNPGGSSGGSAVAVSVNFTTLGIGTDNSGSVRIPAALNGIYGLRPTFGLISQTGIFPRGNMDGTAGPMARNVEDLAILLDVIAKPDILDKKSLNINRPKSYTVYLDKNSLQGKRIGIVTQLGFMNTFAGMPESTRQIILQTLQKMQTFGVMIIPKIQLVNYDLNRAYNEAGEKEDVNGYLAAYPSVRKNYQDICESNRTTVFGDTKACLNFINYLPKKDSSEYKTALQIFTRNKNYVEKVMKQNDLDALLIPVNSTGSATYDSSTFSNETLASNAGLPGITINLGYTTENMPIGFELIGKSFDEGLLISLAYAYEKNMPERKIPLLPEKNVAIQTLAIAEYNNLLTEIGYSAYEKILSHSSNMKFSKDLTPDKFQFIVEEKLKQSGVYQD